MSGSRQLLTSSKRCVDDCLEGVVAANPGFYLFPEQRVVVERGWLLDQDGTRRRRQVAMISGGGSGHEPALAGYVGSGMLAASVAGHIFTSPSPTSVAAAITAVGRDNPDGVLVVCFNYTGDRINFGLAVERCRAAGMKVEMHINGEDTALTKLEGTAGRRGLCGTMFIFKIVGAMLEAGASLSEAMETCKKMRDAMGTIGVAASGCTLPGATAPLFTVPEGHLELGLGVHGECGAATIKSGSAQEVVEALLNHLTREDSDTRLPLQRGEPVALMVNNLGCLSVLEMSNLMREAVRQLGERGVCVVRVYHGPIMTSLDMRGFHIAVLRLLDPTWLTHLDAPTTAPAWPQPCLFQPQPGQEAATQPDLMLTLPHQVMGRGYTLTAMQAETLKACLEAVVSRIPQHEQQLNDLDTLCGDGDCGSTLLAGVTGLSKQMGSLDLQHPGQVLSVVGEEAASSMGGTSGGIYSILLTAAAAQMPATPSGTSHRSVWAKALRAGVKAITRYGGAKQGDRTLLDALVPAVEVLEVGAGHEDQDLRAILKAMAAAADEGAKKTASMKARAGRASYVRAENVRGEDAGARSVACVLQAMTQY